MYRQLLLDDVQWSERGQQVEYGVGVDYLLGLIRQRCSRIGRRLLCILQTVGSNQHFVRSSATLSTQAWRISCESVAPKQGPLVCDPFASVRPLG